MASIAGGLATLSIVITWLDNDSQPLPPTSSALDADSEAPGLLAAGGSLTIERLTEAYGRGVFPWYSNGQPPLWWTPDPRMVLQVADFKLSRSLRKTIARFAADPSCTIRIDSAFRQVIDACAGVPRSGQGGTWIVPALIDAYAAWHRQGVVHSVETWISGELVGGLYGVGLGRMFFGESMFSRRTDASKIALAALVCFCRAHGIDLIDCQQRTDHLASLGANEISRSNFEMMVKARVHAPAPATWIYDRSMWSQLLLSAPAVEPDGPRSAKFESTRT